MLAQDREKWLLKNYSMTVSEWEAMYKAQGGRCKICMLPFEKTSVGGKRPCVDHIKGTKKVRALLCHHCNVLIGNAKENPFTISRAIAYLHHFGIAGDYLDYRHVDLPPPSNLSRRASK